MTIEPTAMSNTGPWALTPHLQYDRLIERLNLRLRRRSLLLVETATNDAPSELMKSHHVQLRDNQLVRIGHDIGGGECLIIPFHDAIKLSVEPLEYKGQSYPCRLDIVGDHVRISSPFLYELPKTHVEYRKYVIVAPAGTER